MVWQSRRIDCTHPGCDWFAMTHELFTLQQEKDGKWFNPRVLHLALDLRGNLIDEFGNMVQQPYQSIGMGNHTVVWDPQNPIWEEAKKDAEPTRIVDTSGDGRLGNPNRDVSGEDISP